MHSGSCHCGNRRTTPTGIALGKHIFGANHGDCFAITDGLPQRAR